MPVPLLPLLTLLDVKKIIRAVVANWRECLVVGMACIIWYQNFNETRWMFGAETIPSLELRLEGATAAVKICKAGNDTLSNTIDTRNEEVQKWKAISKVLEKDIADLNTILIAKREDTKKEVDVILKSDTPKTCEASINYLRDARKDLQWKN